MESGKFLSTGITFHFQLSTLIQKFLIVLPDNLKPIFEPELIQAIEKHGKLVKVEAGETILQPGQTVRSMPIIIKGVVKITRVDEEGHEILLYYVNAMESCAMTFTCCMQSKASEIEAVAEQDVEMITIPVDKMDAWMTEYPSWKAFVMQTIQARFDEMLKAIDHIAFQKLDERLVDYLIQKSKVTNSTLINLSHDQIAHELATSRVVVSRLLKKLENDEKVLLYRNQIKLRNSMLES